MTIRPPLLLLALIGAADALRCAWLHHRHHLRRALPPLLAETEGPDEDAVFEAELRKAMSRLPDEELAASDRRAMDSMVEGRKSEFAAFESSFDQELKSVQDALDSKIEESSRKLESETMARIDAAVAALRRGGGDSAGAGASGDGGAAAAAGSDGEAELSAELPPGALVVVAGGGTALGREVLRQLGEAEGGYQLRSLELDGAPAAADGVDTRQFAPFAPSALKRDLADAAAVVIVSAAVGGKGGVEAEAVGKLAKGLGGGLRRVTLVSGHGTLRAGQLPFSLRNLLGQLDKLRAAEQEVVLRAARDVPAHAVLRLGRLAPPSSSVRAGEGRAELSPGDAGDAPCCAQAAAQCVVESLVRREAVNVTFSLAQPADALGPLPATSSAAAASSSAAAAASSSAGGGGAAAAGAAAAADTAAAAPAGGEAWWEDEWLKLVGPEVLRVPLVSLGAAEAAEWLREWSQGLLRPGRGLTTPIEVVPQSDGALLRFLKSSGAGYDDVDAAEESDDPWRQKGAAAAMAKAIGRDKPDGALRLVAEAAPSARVRVCRAEMGPGVQAKEMSEQAVLARLAKDLADVEAARKRR